MAIEYDVIVIGGGIAGLTAGIAAAREGRDVTVVSATESTLRQASGLVDLLGYPSLVDGPVADPLSAIANLSVDHPYRIVGATGVRAAFALFDEIAGDAYGGSPSLRNVLIPTHGGTVKPTMRYPHTVGAGVASDGRDVLLIGFEWITDFDAPYAAKRLEAANVPFAVRGETIVFPGSFRADARLTRFAHALDRDEKITISGESRGVRDIIAERIRDRCDGEPRVGVPALLGIDRAREVHRELEERIGAEVFEIPMGPPSVLGMRLANLLEAKLQEAGGHLHTGAPVTGYEATDGHIERLLVERNGARIPYAATEFILATGGLVGKGVRSDRDKIVEPLFDCHVPHPADRDDWYVDDAFGRQPFPRFGVQPDAALRPCDHDGHPHYDNLRAAGGVIGGFDFAAEKSGAGVSLATGACAGRWAAEVGS